MWPSSTLPTMWSSAWKSRFGSPSRLVQVDSRPRSRAGTGRVAASGRPGCAGSRRRWRSRRPDGAVLVGDVRRPRAATVAPARRACAMQRSTSGTSSAMSTTPSPCRRWWSASGLSGSTAPLMTKRIEPERSTNDLWSRLPCLRAGVGLQLHAPRGLVVVRGLGGVADDEDDRVPAGHREDVARPRRTRPGRPAAAAAPGSGRPSARRGSAGAQGVGHAAQHGARRTDLCNSTTKHCTTCPARRPRGRSGRHLLHLFAERAPHRRAGGLPPAGGGPRHRAGPAGQAGRAPASSRAGARELRAGGARPPGDRVPHPGDPAGRRPRLGAAHLAGIPEVLEVYTITGAGDMWARVVARSNADLQRVIDAVLSDDGSCGPRP